MPHDPLTRMRAFLGPEMEAERAQRSTLGRRGKYELVREMARGGMGVVYEGFDTELGRVVAIKVMKDAPPGRLQREAGMAARLKHPNILVVHEVGDDFIVMEHLAGETLERLWPTLPGRRRIEVLELVARAAGYAHAHGVIHRDIKPGNVMIEPDGRVVLMDFGLAKSFEEKDLTLTGSVLGTPHYMAPEQVRSDRGRIGPPTDVWALGAMLYEAVTDRKPFDGATSPEVFEKIVREEPAPAPGELGAVALKALDKVSGRRYPDGTALADDLRRFLDGLPVLARPVGLATAALRRVRRAARSRWLVGVAGALAVALLIIGVRAGRERGRVVEALREQARVSLQAGLELRRAGAVDRMRQFLPPLESAYRRARKAAPRLAEPDYLLGRMYRALLDNERALERQEEALARNPAFWPAGYERAVLLSLGVGGPSAEARREAWRRVIEQLEKPEARANEGMHTIPVPALALKVARGVLAAEEHRSQEARLLLQEALVADPFLDEAAEALARLIRSEVDRSNTAREAALDEAEAVLTAQLDRDRGYVPALRQRGDLRLRRALLYRHSGSDPMPALEGARADFRSAADMQPTQRNAWIGGGDAETLAVKHLYALGLDTRDACAAGEKAFGHAISLPGEAARAHRHRGIHRFHCAVDAQRRGEDPEALLRAAEADLSRSIQLRPRSPDAYAFRAQVKELLASNLARKGGDPTSLFDEAESDLERTLEMRPRDHRAWFWRSMLWAERAEVKLARGLDAALELARAQAHYARALEAAPAEDLAWKIESGKHGGNLHVLQGRRLEGLGDRAGARREYAAAAATFRQALEANPHLERRLHGALTEAMERASALESAGSAPQR